MTNHTSFTRGYLKDRIEQCTSRCIIFEGKYTIGVRVKKSKVDDVLKVMENSVPVCINYIVHPFKWYEYLTVWSIKFKDMRK